MKTINIHPSINGSVDVNSVGYVTSRQQHKRACILPTEGNVSKRARILRTGRGKVSTKTYRHNCSRESQDVQKNEKVSGLFTCGLTAVSTTRGGGRVVIDTSLNINSPRSRFHREQCEELFNEQSPKRTCVQAYVSCQTVATD